MEGVTPELILAPPGHDNTESNTDYSVNLVSLSPAPLMRVQVELDGRTLVALVDTGATASLIQASCCATIVPCDPRDIVGLGGTTAALGSFLSHVKIAGLSTEAISFLVVPDSCIDCNVVLGSDFFTINRIVVDMGKSTLRQKLEVGWSDVRVSGGGVPDIFFSRLPIYASCDVEVHAGDVVKVPVQCSHIPTGDVFYNGDIGLHYLRGVDGVMNFKAGESDSGGLSVMMCHPAHARKRVEVIRSGTVVGSISSIVDVEVDEDTTSGHWTGQRLQAEVDLSGLSELEVKSVQNMLLTRKTAFSAGDEDVGRAAVTEHRIELDDYTPIRQRPRRFPEPVVEAIEEQCRQLQALDIIAPSKSAWSSPVVPIRKKDGSIRLCIDYRKVNAVTRPDRFPMPNLTDLVFSLHGMLYFTSLDLVRGYYQVPLAKPSQEITAFSTTRSHYEFKRLSFGLKNAPAAFQREMQEILKGYLGKQVIVYIDDILIMSRTFTEHLELVEAVLGTLCEYGIKVKVEKCQWFRTHVPFLGHIVGRDGLRKAPEYVRRVQEFTRPETVHQLRQFLGLLNFQRKFIPDCSQIAKPLKGLTGGSKRDRLVWTPSMDAAFERLKVLMGRDLLLSFPDYSVDASPLELYVDASGCGAGACLMQVQRGETRAIAYNSMTFSKPQQQYSTIDRELAAIRWGVKVFRPFLYGVHFILYTDHRPLIFMRNMSSENSRVARTLQELSEFDFELRYCRGEDNTAADALSRLSHSVEAPVSRGCASDFLPDGLRVLESVPGGGDSMVTSLFVALRNLLGEDSEKVLPVSVDDLRTQLVDELGSHSRKYGQKVLKLRKGDLACLKRSGQLLPEVALLAFSEVFGVQVWVHCGMDRPVIHALSGVPAAGPSKRVHLQWLAGVHYNPVLEMDEYVPALSGEPPEFVDVVSAVVSVREDREEEKLDEVLQTEQSSCDCLSVSCPTVVVSFGTRTCCALVDTGAQVSLIREDVFAMLPEEVKRFADLETSSLRLRGVGGGFSPVEGVVRLMVTVAGRVLVKPHPFAVVSRQSLPFCALLGANFITSNGVKLDFSAGCMSVVDGSGGFMCVFRPRTGEETRVQFCFQHELAPLPYRSLDALLSMDDLLSMQRHDPLLVSLAELVLERTLPEQWGNPDLQRFRRFSERFLILAGVLYCDVDGAAVPVVSCHFMIDVLFSFHSRLAHIGRHKLLQAVRTVIWHPDLYRVANDVCVTCLRCQTFKVSHQPISPPVIKIETSSPFELVSVDLIDFPRCPRGFKTVLMVVDHFSKWLVAVPLKDKRGETVARGLEHSVLPVLPKCPVRLLSDNGPEFRSTVFEEVLRKNGVVHTFSTPYCPASNGGVERANRTIAEMLRGLASCRGDWDLQLSRAVMIYNSTLHRGLDMSPSACLLTRAHEVPQVPVLPADVQDVWKEGHPRFVPFAVGQKVLYRRHQPGNLVTNKLEPRYTGPFVVTQVRENKVTYVIRQDLQGGKSLTRCVHYRQIKAYHEPPAYLAEHPCFLQEAGQTRAAGGSESDSDDFPLFYCGSASLGESSGCDKEESLAGEVEVPPALESLGHSDLGDSGRAPIESRRSLSGLLEKSGSSASFHSCPGQVRACGSTDPRLSVSDGALLGRSGRKKRVRRRAPLRAPIQEDLASLSCTEKIQECPVYGRVEANTVPVEALSLSSTLAEVHDVQVEEGPLSSTLAEGHDVQVEEDPLSSTLAEGLLSSTVAEGRDDHVQLGSPERFGLRSPAEGVASNTVEPELSPVDVGLGKSPPLRLADLSGILAGSGSLVDPAVGVGSAGDAEVSDFLGFDADNSSESFDFGGFVASPRVERLRDLRRIIQDARLSIAQNRRRSFSRRCDGTSGSGLSVSPGPGLTPRRMQTRSCGVVDHVRL